MTSKVKTGRCLRQREGGREDVSHVDDCIFANYARGCGARPEDAQGLLPDKKTAELIGEAVLIGQYGDERVNAERPLLVDDSNKDYWIVQMAPRKYGMPEIGGGPAVWINKHSGCVKVMDHMK